MSGVLIVNPLAHAVAPAAPGTGGANLLTPDPNEAWLAPAVGVASIDIDLGQEQLVDSIFLGFTNATAAAHWSISTATAPGEGLVERHAGSLRAADSIGPRHHAFVRLPVPVASRYFRITTTQSDAEALYAGIVVVGLAFEKYREFGGGRTPIDTSARQDLIGGGFGIGEGVTKAQFDWSFVDLSDAELQRLWAIKMDRGLRKPVLVVEDADLTIGQNEAIHYGLFARFQAYERQDPAQTRWAGSILQWV
ncbi:hypothetical protein [Sphingobium aquiterrae]|uniref:hypothetical protein n=1 Tax=Sphingobium aquiterrae TaxID=2038656 RepID=UPI003015C9D5